MAVKANIVLTNAAGEQVICEQGAELAGNGTDDLNDLVGGGVGSGAGYFVVTGRGSPTIFGSYPVGEIYTSADGLGVPKTGDLVRKLTATGKVMGIFEDDTVD